jgi:hypothetical protein
MLNGLPACADGVAQTHLLALATVRGKGFVRNERPFHVLGLYATER